MALVAGEELAVLKLGLEGADVVVAGVGLRDLITESDGAVVILSCVQEVVG